MSQESLFEQSEPEHIELDSLSRLSYFPAWLQQHEADTLLNILIQQSPWEQPTIVVAGKTHKIPRLQAWYGDDGAVMEYSGQRFTPNAWTPALHKIRKLAESTAQTCLPNSMFNSVLINHYRDGQDSVSWHADNEKELGQNPVIASVSLGAARIFSLKSRTSGQVVKLPLQHGDFLVMHGATQHRWLHAVLKDKSSLEPRINLTFRNIVKKSAD